MSRALRFLPLLLVLALLAALGWRLAQPDDRAVASNMVGKRVPAFALPPALPERPGLASGDLNSPRLVNFFASWCVPCIAEAPLLMELKRGGVPIDGIAVRDRAADVATFLATRGDPYSRIGADRDSRAQILLGASGVPETFVIDGRGVIRYQHVGPIEPADIATVRREWEAAK